MTKNPYIVEHAKTTGFGVIGQGLLGIGFLLPPPFNFIVAGIGLVSTSIGFFYATDRTMKRANLTPHETSATHSIETT